MMLRGVTLALAAVLLWLTITEARHHRHSYKKHTHVSKSFIEDHPNKRAKLPDLNILLTGTKFEEDGVVFDIGECKVKLSISGKCKLTLTPSPDTCGGKVPLGSILNHFLPKNNIAEKSNTFILPDKFDVQLVEIDKCESTLQLKTVAREKLDLIPDKLSLEGVSLDLKVDFKTGSIDWELLDLNIAATITFVGKKIPVTLKKKAKETDIKFTFKVDKITIPDFVKEFSKKPLGDGDSDKKVIDKVTGLSLKNPSISGVYDPKGFYEIVFYGEPEGETFKGANFYAIVQKPEDAAVKVALVAKVNMLNPAKLLSDITGKDLTKIPLLKDIDLNFAVEISNEDFVIIKNEDLTKAIKGYASGGKTISKGVKLKIDVPIKDLFKKISSDISTDDLPASLFMKVTIDADGLKFKFPDDWKTDLLKILKAFAPKLKDLLPKWLNSEGPPMVKVNDFSFDYKKMAFTVDVTVPGPLKLGGILQLYNVSLKVSHKDENSPYEFSFSSTQTLLEEIIMETKLSKKGEAGYEFVGTISMISTGQLMKALGAKFVSEETLKKLQFLDFGVKDVKITAKFGDTFYLSVTGTAILFGWDGVQIEGIMYNDKSTPVMALGIVITKVRLDEIVEKMFKKKLSGLTWLSELTVAIVMSTTDAKSSPKRATNDLKFSNPGLKGVPIKKGISFRGEFKIPKDCKGDQLCEVSKNATKDEKTERAFVIEGQITPEGFELKASYNGNWKIGDNVVIPGVTFVVKVGKETKVQFEVVVNVLDPKLTFEGTLGIGGTGSLQLSAKMKGIYENAFEIKYLAFGNLAISVGILPGNPIPSLNLEGELRLGSSSSPSSKSKRAADEDGNKIVAKAALGVDSTNPTNNYFYAKINKFTLDAIAKAFDLNIKLPKVFMETGFPEEVLVSFTPAKAGKELTTLKTKIENGLTFQGKINILGYELFVSCKIGYNPVKFALTVEMSPIKIANGLIALQLSKAEPDKGPLFVGQISEKAVKIKIMAYLTVLGISAGTNIEVSDDGFQFSISGNLFDVVKADLEVKAKYGDIKTASFQVKACISTGPDIVKKEVKETLQSASDEATSTIKDAQKSAAGIEDLYLSSKKGVTKMDKEVEEFQSKLRKEGEKISEAKRMLNEKCIDECSTECIGGPDWDPKCLEVGGKFIGCTVWNDCKFKVPNYDCLAECKGKKLLGKLKAKAKQTALDVLLTLLKGIKKLFNFGKVFFDKSKKLLTTAKEVLKDVSDQVQAGLDAAKAIASTAIESIVQIHSMCFEASLSEAAKACVALNIDATFFKNKKINFEAKGCLDASFIKTIAQAISDKLYPGISSIKDKISGLKSKLGLIEQEKDKVEATVEENDKEDSSKRDVIWTEEENYYRKLAYEQLPRFTLLDEATLKLFTKDTASKFATNDNALARAVIANRSSSVNVLKKRESIDGLESADSCVKLSNVMKGYKDIAYGLHGLANSYEKTKEKFEHSLSRKKSKINRLALGIKSECLYYGCRSDELHDALLYIRKTKEERDSWGRAVRSQIENQDTSAFTVFKSQLDSNFREVTGYALEEFLAKLGRSGAEASKRTAVKPEEGSENADKLQSFAEEIQSLLKEESSITRATPKIRKLVSRMEDIDDLATSCETSR